MLLWLLLLSLQAMWLYEALSTARQKYYLEPRREARGWKVTPVLAAEQQVRAVDMAFCSSPPLPTGSCFLHE